MRRRIIFKYLKLYYFFYLIIVELIILLLVNFILEKGFMYCTNVHSYFDKGNKYTYDFMLGHTHCSAGPHAARGPPVGQPWFRPRYWLKLNFI